MKSLLTLCAIVLCINVKAQNANQQDTSIQLESNIVLVQAHFPGGMDGWAKYLQTNLRADIAGMVIKLKKHQRDSIQTVVVSFLVDTSGNVTGASVINGDQVNIRLADEAIRVIEEGPKWEPAIQNGRPVIYRQHQAISFMVTRG